MTWLPSFVVVIFVIAGAACSGLVLRFFFGGSSSLISGEESFSSWALASPFCYASIS